MTARCPRTGQFGVAVATRVPAVGAAVPHARAGVGAIATQAWTNPYIGLDGLDLLAAGASAAQVVAAGNLLAGPAVLDAMATAFTAGPDDELQVRLLAALAAGQAAGGDKRGKQSAALKVVDREDYPFIDLRVDEHADPIPELQRVYAVWNEQLRPHLASRATRAYLEARSGHARPRLPG
ncbi:MAG: DUF1028 domain-containing protein [Trueperaceae bacterium]|nr:DUF1028 domain-containing protein [Trueperaceae bacterium]